MADFTKFRTSMGGFNRTDVSNYIETLCADHKNALKALEEENQALTERVTILESQNSTRAAHLEEAQKKLAETETALASTEAALTEAMTMVEEKEAQLAEAEAVQMVQVEAANYTAMELEAYRRAEATERLAQERAGRLRLQLSDLLDNVSGRYEQTGQEISALTEDIRINLKRLEEALSDLEVVFDDATAAFDSMDTMLPEEPAAEEE